jgi:hypothetical protein
MSEKLYCPFCKGELKITDIHLLKIKNGTNRKK